MTIVEERLEALVEIFANQKAKINDLDRKVGDLERVLRDERAANKVLMKLLKGKFVSEFVKRLEDNSNDCAQI